jgi:hypothetical protein
MLIFTAEGPARSMTATCFASIATGRTARPTSTSWWVMIGGEGVSGRVFAPAPFLHGSVIRFVGGESLTLATPPEHFLSA